MSELSEMAAAMAREKASEEALEQARQQLEAEFNRPEMIEAIFDNPGAPIPQPVTAASIISADDLIERLLRLPQEIADAEREVIKCESNVLCAKHILLEEEYALLTGDNAPNGKNAETRAAQTAVALAPYRNTVEHHEEGVRWAKRELTLLQNTFSATKAIVRLLEGGRG